MISLWLFCFDVGNISTAVEGVNTFNAINYVNINVKNNVDLLIMTCHNSTLFNKTGK